MIHSVVRTKLEKKVPVFCAKASYADPEIVEMIGRAGYDCVWICAEHRQFDPSVMQSMILAARVSGCDCLVRVKPENHTDLAYLLDAGVRGIMLPQVRDVEEVERVAEMMNFPPEGRRGLDPIHADTDMGNTSVAEYVGNENRNTFLMAQIETVEAVSHIDAIAALPNVDLLFVGLGDLSANMGIAGQMDHPELQDVVRATGEACLRHGKAAAIIAPDASERDRLWKLGYRFFTIASDFRFIKSGFTRSIEDARAWESSL